MMIRKISFIDPDMTHYSNAATLSSLHVRKPSVSGNSILPVYAADPHIYLGDDRYVLAATHAGIYSSMEAFDAGDGGAMGHGFALWSSSNLREWCAEGSVLRFADISWASNLDRAWAPCTAQRNGRTYFYFCAADRIGVAVGNSPLGPFRDALGAPLIPYRSDLSAIDPMVFIDDDGQAYLFWGAVPAEWLEGEVDPIRTHLSVQKLASDMVTLQGEEIPTLHTFPDPDGLKRFGPHIEASHVIRRDLADGTPCYYLMYSQGSWSNLNDEYLYHVRYATASHPLGPWTKQSGVILSTRRDLEMIGPGHHSTLQMPGTDEWLIAYHAHKGDCDRRVFLDRMEFGASGEILPVTLTTTSPPPCPIELALKLDNFGPFDAATPVKLKVIAHRAFERFEFFDGNQPIGALEGTETFFIWHKAPSGFHRISVQGFARGGVVCQSNATDFDQV